MEFRLQALGFMDIFTKQQSSDDCCCVKKSMKFRGRSLDSMELNISI